MERQNVQMFCCFKSQSDICTGDHDGLARKIDFGDKCLAETLPSKELGDITESRHNGFWLAVGN